MRSRLALWWVVGLGLCAAVEEAAITGGLHELYPVLDLVFLTSLALLVLIGWSVERLWAVSLFAVAPASAFGYSTAEHHTWPVAEFLELAPLGVMLIALGVLLRRLLAPVDSRRTTGGLAGSGLR